MPYHDAGEMHVHALQVKSHRERQGRKGRARQQHEDDGEAPWALHGRVPDGPAVGAMSCDLFAAQSQNPTRAIPYLDAVDASVVEFEEMRCGGEDLFGVGAYPLGQADNMAGPVKLEKSAK